MILTTRFDSVPVASSVRTPALRQTKPATMAKKMMRIWCRAADMGKLLPGCDYSLSRLTSIRTGLWSELAKSTFRVSTLSSFTLGDRIRPSMT